jgi:RNA 3'-terminal phosphate cyclase (ATP)
MREGLGSPGGGIVETAGGIVETAGGIVETAGGIVEIDGGRGEGGGQILRTSLALSMITGRPLVMHRIRAGRAKPGLRRQHLACVQAAARLCNARVTGDRVGSQALEFEPGSLDAAPTELTIDIGTAGSTSLVVQTILVPAIVAGRGLTARVIGGTHNPMAPPFDFLERVFLPHLRAMGARVAMALDRHGFAVGGGAPGKQDWHDDETPHRGQLTLTVDAADAARAAGAARAADAAGAALRPIELLEAGPITARRAIALLARLPTHVGERELGVVRERLGFAAADCQVVEVAGGGPANVLLVEIERAGGRELVTRFGEKGLRAELVASRACDELDAFLRAGVPVGEHLADQLLLPLAVAGGGRFRCAPLSSHAITNIETIRRFLDVPIRVDPDPGPGGDTVVVSLGASMAP